MSAAGRAHPGVVDSRAMKTRTILTAAVVLALLALVGCGGDDDGDSTAADGPSIRTVEIALRDFSLDPARISLEEAGVYTLHVVNQGQTTHALEVEGVGVEEEISDLAPGDSADLKIDVDKGDYDMYCPVDGHKAKGMEGRIVVGGGNAE
jgi:plastocyanin